MKRRRHVARTMEDKKVLLKMLHKASPKLKRALLADLPPELVHLLSECALNILKGVVVLKPKQKATLQKHKEQIRDLAQPKTTVKKKKEIIQKGGLLGAVLGAVLPALLGPALMGR